MANIVRHNLDIWPGDSYQAAIQAIDKAHVDGVCSPVKLTITKSARVLPRTEKKEPCRVLF